MKIAVKLETCLLFMLGSCKIIKNSFSVRNPSLPADEFEKLQP